MAIEDRSQSFAEVALDWQMIRDIRAGTRAVRAGGKTYLPQFSEEGSVEFQRRVDSTPWTAIYEDCAATVVAKPFGKDVALQGEIPARIAELCENIDRAGSNLSVFARSVFEEAVHLGASYIVVDYPKLEGDTPNLAAERAAGGRAYFRLVTVDQLLGIAEQDGRIVHFRFRDDVMALNEETFEEVVTARVRLLKMTDTGPVSELWVKGENGFAMDPDQSGPMQGVDALPIVPLLFGLELGSRYVRRPSLMGLAWKQIEHYQQGSRINELFDFAGFPMLAANGVAPPQPTIVDGVTLAAEQPIVSPRTILYGGENGSFAFVEPAGKNAEVMMKRLQEIEAEARMIGLQPVMPSRGMQNVAATTSAINAAKAHSVVQAWAFMLKDALELALVYMAKWEGVPETTEVFVHSDFAPETMTTDDFADVRELRAINAISRDTLLDEAMRRGVLGPQFDKARDADLLDAAGDTVGGADV